MDKVCTYCGQAGHRAHACPRREPWTPITAHTGIVNFDEIRVTPAPGKITIEYLLEGKITAQESADWRAGQTLRVNGLVGGRHATFVLDN